VNSGLYYKPMTIINDDSRVVNKLEASLTDDTRVVIYERQMFILKATGCMGLPPGVNVIKLFFFTADDKAK
jgi:hypothetical protein